VTPSFIAALSLSVCSTESEQMCAGGAVDSKLPSLSLLPMRFRDVASRHSTTAAGRRRRRRTESGRFRSSNRWVTFYSIIGAFRAIYSCETILTLCSFVFFFGSKRSGSDHVSRTLQASWLSFIRAWTAILFCCLMQLELEHLFEKCKSLGLFCPSRWQPREEYQSMIRTFPNTFLNDPMVAGTDSTIIVHELLPLVIRMVGRSF